MILSEKDKKRILEKIPEAIEAIADNNVNALLDVIDDFVLMDIMENDDEPTDMGREFELIRDRIWSDNPE